MAFSEKTVNLILEYQRTKQDWLSNHPETMDEDDLLRGLFEVAKTNLASWVSTEYDLPMESDG